MSPRLRSRQSLSQLRMCVFEKFAQMNCWLLNEVEPECEYLSLQVKCVLRSLTYQIFIYADSIRQTFIALPSPSQSEAFFVVVSCNVIFSPLA